MSIIDELLEKTDASNDTDKVRELCSRIKQEEEANFQWPVLHMVGPTIFLCLELGESKGELGFLTLEKEFDTYLIVYYTVKVPIRQSEEPVYKKRRAKQLTETKPEKVLAQYAKYYTEMRGE